MKFIPQRSARLGFMAEAIREAGFARDFALYMARLIPDIIVFNAVFVNPRPVTLEVIQHERCYLRIDEKLIYIGSANYRTGVDYLTRNPIYANRPCLSVLTMSDKEALSFDPSSLIDEAAKRFPTAIRWNQESPTKITIDLRTHLREFAEAADE